MAALDAADWTVTITERWHAGTPAKRHVRGTLALAGVDTYPAGGIPLPTKENLGLIRNLDILLLTGQTVLTTMYGHQVDYANNKLVLFEEEAVAAGGPLPEADTAEVPGPRTWQFEAVGW